MVTGRADEVELVDLTPEKLLERLKEGKVYVPQKAEQAMRQFFRKGNLLALRELSLNYTAKHVDDDFRSYMEKHAIPGPWPVGSRLLVAVSASPTSQQLLRFTHRLAKDLDAEWFAAYVESPQQLRIDKKSRVLLDRNIRLAEELGARTVPLSGKDIADELLKFARSKNVTLILTGTPKRTRLEEYFKGTIVDELIDKSGPIHVLVMGEADYDKTANENYPSMMKADYRAYFYSLALVSAFAAGGWIMRAGLEPVNIGMLLLLPAIASGMLWGIRVGLFASLLSVGVFDFLFVPPYLTFRITDFRYMPSFFMFVLVSVTVSYLSKSIREESEISAHRERFVYSLYSFSREMIEARGREEILHRAVSHIAEAFECDVAILLPDNGNKIRVAAVNASGIELNEAEKAVALWVCGNGQPAGRSTKTLSASEWYFLPLKVQDETIGTMGLKGRQERKFLTPDQNKLLESFAGVVALAIRKQ
jgi:two-component system sensor histidine kinase KdpD